MSDQHDLFNHSITDLDSFSTSLDFDRHLPSVEAREEFLSQLMDEEEIEGPESDDFQSSFACDMERSIPARLGTIDDLSEEEEEEECSTNGDTGESLSKSNHRAGGVATVKA